MLGYKKENLKFFINQKRKYMKKIISLLLLINFQLASSQEPMIINRTGQDITIAYEIASGAPLFTTDNIIKIKGSADHKADEMVLIPSTSVVNLHATPAGTMYKTNATKAIIKVGNATVDIPSFASNTSYIIEAGTTKGTFVAKPELITEKAQPKTETAPSAERKA